ncbi:unnamed protein product [Dibothriocephalus latus]|uniref:Uncharacterized protein n=1 Tax=Dibothriocephalus latus TaxID=60516 RepID=A0A3P7Q2Y9_DIBLA|nr:unnamed protein product [Dibothriocephalus latus]
MNGYIKETPMYYELQTTDGPTKKEFNPKPESVAQNRAYYVTDFTGVASVTSQSWVLLGILFISLFSLQMTNMCSAE